MNNLGINGTTFLDELETLGYPTGCRNVAVANGNQRALRQGLGDNANYIGYDIGRGFSFPINFL
jgi:hypothetical protein